MKAKLLLLFYIFLQFGISIQTFCTNNRSFTEKDLVTVNLADSFKTNNKVDKVHYAELIKKEFLHAWQGYRKFAWAHDELKPLSKSYNDWYGQSLFITPVDAFDTMILMGLKKEAADAKELILQNLSFDKNIFVQNFEITIRLLGGLLSAFELDGDRRFLTLAEDLGKRLLPVFNSKTGMPYVYVNLKTGETKNEINNPAEIGTLMLEFGTLSALTRNPIYYHKAKRAVVELFKRRSKIGLIGSEINVNTGEWVNTKSHISGMIDSYYEYLLKSYLLFGDKDFKVMFDSSMNAVNKYLADSANANLWYATVDMKTGEKILTTFGALDAFLPAVFCLSGDVKRAESLMESCFKMWKDFGIEPEKFDYENMNIINPQYLLRPENVESAYYLYHFTKNEKYINIGKYYFESIVKYCKTKDAFAALKNVTTKEKQDIMPSFFLAETLKYLYLLFTDEDETNFDKVIFNTEAHPLKKIHETK
ncbi:glycoside hydrolase family 47 protein [Melioribacteraceae bacterium 4301-Me]|uniref:glycoside hydrolase family 47 protein n=1 Tax=Pyranulibacter aquaticus TaxID=3163344 RepID=UPI00359B736C